MSKTITIYLFEKYGVPQEIVNLILREAELPAHKSSFTPAIEDIKNGTGKLKYQRLYTVWYTILLE